LLLTGIEDTYKEYKKGLKRLAKTSMSEEVLGITNRNMSGTKIPAIIPG
jgi:hypothetical protein